MSTPLTVSKATQMCLKELGKALDVCSRSEGRARKVWTKEYAEQIKGISVRDLLHDDYFFGKVGGGGVWPVHLDDIEELWARRRSPECVSLFVDQEGIGGGKTTKAAAISALLLLEALTTWDLRLKYNLNDDSKIVIIAMSQTMAKSRDITFDRMLSYFASPFFIDYFPPNIRKEDFDPVEQKFLRYPASIRFPGNVLLFPGSASGALPIGYDIYGMTIDEANYLPVVEKSKKEPSKSKFDAAEAIFEEGFARIKSRFGDDGGVRGLLTMISNPRYVGDFMFRIIQLVERGAREGLEYLPPTMVRRRATWEARPIDMKAKEYFEFDTDTMQVVGFGSYDDPNNPTGQEIRNAA